MKLTAQDTVFQVCCFLFLAVAGGAVAYPLIYVIASSFSSPAAIATGRVVFLPVEFSVNSYKAVLDHPLLRSGFVNSLFYVAGGTTVAVSLILLSAYPLSRKDMPDRKLFLVFFMVTMFFGGGIVPAYMLMRNLGLVGSRWALVIGAGFSCYNMIIVKTYFQNSLPAGLLDAAHIDGCGDVRFFFTIALPLAVPVIAVMVLFNAVGIWNSYFSGMLYLTRSNTFNFQMVLREILFISQVGRESLEIIDPLGMASLTELYQQLRYAVLVIGALPMMVLYPFIQKYFVRGIMIGSLKE